MTKARDHDDLSTAIARLRDQQVAQTARAWIVTYYPPPTAECPVDESGQPLSPCGCPWDDVDPEGVDTD